MYKNINRLILMHETMIRLYEVAKSSFNINGQTELARKLNHSPQTLNNWEDRGMSKAGILLTYSIFGIDTEWLSTGEGSPFGIRLKQTDQKSDTTFGERVKSARNVAGISQAELAHLVGVGQSSVAQTEAEGMSSTKVLEYAKALNVNPNWLDTGKGLRVIGAGHPLDAYKETFNNLSNSDKDFLIVILDALKIKK